MRIIPNSNSGRRFIKDLTQIRCVVALVPDVPSGLPEHGD
jgi:hypothetical protein